MTPPIISRAFRHRDRLALVAPEGSFSYHMLLAGSAHLANRVLAGQEDLAGARVAILAHPGFGYVSAQWAIWRAGGVAVPMAVGHPPRELEFILDDAEPVAVLAHPDLVDGVRSLVEQRGLHLLDSEEATRVALDPAAVVPDTTGLPDVDPERPALMIYTSGTTGRPKGVVTTHANISAQIRGLVQAWAWSENDRILLVLPLHHVHGIVNVLSCALWSGACCEVHPRFDAVRVWDRFAEGGLTLFMAVPTIYGRLIQAWSEARAGDRARWSAGAAELRLMVSGSAALPRGVLDEWTRITGHVLLERYGMTEIGMGLGNPLEGPRRPGHVGVPFPGVEIRLVGEDGGPVEDGAAGEIQIRGPSVFREYWRRPSETADAFVDGWFRSGDVAVLDQGSYRILGRSSVDIIKTGGEKVSALEVEETLREHPALRDCAVVGVADPAWGERVCALVVPTEPDAVDAESLRAWARTRMAPFKVPGRVLMTDALPRNAMGKVTKPEVRTMFESVPSGRPAAPMSSSDPDGP